MRRQLPIFPWSTLGTPVGLPLALFLLVVVASQARSQSLGGSWIIVGSDTSFSLPISGTVDAFNSRRYKQENIFDAGDNVIHNGAENNDELLLANTGNGVIVNPTVVINGKGFLYSIADWLREIDLHGLKSTDDTLRAVWAYCADNLYHWPISSWGNSWKIPSLRFYNIFGSGLCHDAAQMSGSLLKALGFNSSISYSVAAGSHTVDLVRLPDGREVTIDPDIRVVYPSASGGRLASLVEMHADQGLIWQQHHYGVAAAENSGRDKFIGNLYSKRLAPDYQDRAALDSVQMALRPGESYRFSFKPSQITNRSYYHFYYKNSLPYGAPPTACKGTQVYSPAPSDSVFEATSAPTHVRFQGLDSLQRGMCLAGDTSASLLISMPNPYALLGGKIGIRYLSNGDTTAWLRCSARKNAGDSLTLLLQRSGIVSGWSIDTVSLDAFIAPSSTPMTCSYQVKLEWGAADTSALVIDSLWLTSDFQFNPQAVPRLRVGDNSVRIASADGGSLNGLQYSQTCLLVNWVTVPPAVAQPVRPVDGSTVATGKVHFEWQLPPGSSIGQFSDFNIQVSDDSLFRFPVSSNFNALVTRSPGGVRTNWITPSYGDLHAGQTYYWRVASRSLNGGYSPWSPTWRFTVDAPRAIQSGRVVTEGDSTVLRWAVDGSGKQPDHFLIAGNTLKGFVWSDSLIVDSTRNPWYTVNKRNRHQPWAFYRVVPIALDGARGVPSALIAVDTLRFFFDPVPVVNAGDTINVPFTRIQPFDTYQISGQPERRVTDSLMLDLSASAPKLLLRNDSLFCAPQQLSDTAFVFQGNTSDSHRSFGYNLGVHVNHPPALTVTADTMVSEDSNVIIPFRKSDADGDAVTVSAVRLPQWLHVDTVGSVLTGIPRGIDCGDSTWTLRAMDPFGGRVLAFMRLRVLHVNHDPVIDSLTVRSVAEDSTLRSRIDSRDQDSQLFGDTLTYALGSGPAWVTVDKATGKLQGTPGGQDVGTPSVTVTVTDGRGGAATRTFSLEVTHTNHPPVFSAISNRTAVEDSLYAGNLHASDADSALFGDRVAYRGVKIPAWLTLDSVSGAVSGMPRIQNLQDTSLVVQAIDGKGGATTQTTSILIQHVNHVPEIVSDPPFHAAEDTLLAYRVVATDIDTLVGDVLTYSAPRKPTWLSINAVTGLLSGTPLGVNVGDTSVVVRVSDGKGGVATEMFYLHVAHTNHAPAFAPFPPAMAVEDSLWTGRVHAADLDSALFGDKISYRFTRKPQWVTLDSLTGQLSGVPRLTDLADTLAVVQANDGAGGMSSQQVTIPVQHVNHAPTIASIPPLRGAEDTLLTYRVIATDPDTLIGDTLTFTFSAKPAWLSLDTHTGILSGIPPAVSVGDTAAGITVSDGKGGTAAQAVPMHITHTNHAPVFRAATVPPAIEDSAWSVKVHATDVDSLLFGDRVTYRFSLKPAWVTLDSTSGVLQGTPGLHNLGDSIAVLAAFDGKGGMSTQRMAITVLHVNHSPTLMSIPVLHAAEDTLLSYRVAATDPDTLVGDALTYSITTGPSWLRINSQSGVISGVPAAWNVGDTLAVIQASDLKGSKVSGTAIIHVAHTNHNPVIAAQTPPLAREDSVFHWHVAVSDTDARAFGDSMTFRILHGPDWLSVGPHDGVVSGVPGARDVVSADTVLMLRVSDGKGGSASGQFRLRFSHTNHPPVVSTQSVSAAREDSLYTVRIVAFDPDSARFGDRVSFHPDNLPAWVSLDSVSGEIHGVPRGANVGGDSLVVLVTDGKGGNVRAALPLDVLHTNHAPVFQSQGDSTAAEDTIFSYAPRVTDQDSLLFHDQLVYRLTVRPSWLSIDTLRGTVTGVPRLANVGDTIAVIMAEDHKGGTASQRLPLHVHHTNHRPRFAGPSTISVAATEHGRVRFTVHASDVDSALFGDRVEYRAIVRPSWLSIASGSGIVSGTPEEDDHDTVMVLGASDGWQEDSLRVVVSVLEVNDPPQFVSAPDSTVNINALYQWKVPVADPDRGDSVRIVLVKAPDWLRLDSTGTVTGRPRKPGSYPVAIAAVDRGGLADTIRFTIKAGISLAVSDLNMGIPATFVLEQNYPNPFNPFTTLRFGLPAAGIVELSVFNALGQHAGEVLHEHLTAGYHELVWIPYNLASGVYFLVMNGHPDDGGSSFRSVRKLLLLK